MKVLKIQEKGVEEHFALRLPISLRKMLQHVKKQKF